MTGKRSASGRLVAVVKGLKKMCNILVAVVFEIFSMHDIYVYIYICMIMFYFYLSRPPGPPVVVGTLPSSLRMTDTHILISSIFYTVELMCNR